MTLKEYNMQVKEFEGILQKIATEITSGILFERLPPNELWNKAEVSITRLKDLAEAIRDFALIIKPEKAVAIEQKSKILLQSLTTFKDILFQNTTNPLANSRLAFEQLKKAVEDGSEFLVLAKEAQDSPSPVIESILKLREFSEAKGPVITIQAPEELQPIITRLMNRIEALRTAFMSIEKAVGEAKEQLRNLQEESLNFGTTKKNNTEKMEEINEAKVKQTSLVSKFETS